MGDLLSPTIKSLLINGCLIILAYTFFVSIIVMIGGGKLFTSAKKDKLTAYLPLINLFGLLEIVEMSSFWGILFFIPIFNLLSIGIMMYKLGTEFNQKESTKWGLVFLPIIFYPLLTNGECKYKTSDEDMFKALDNAKAENINLLTPDEIKDINKETNEKIENVDNVFKSEVKVEASPTPYKATKVDVLETTEKEEIEDNEFKPIEMIPQEIQGKEENKEVKEENKVEYVDL